LIAKRLMDVLLSALGIVVLAVPMAVIALIVKLDSPGPALFRQERVGRGGTTFRMLKFRTMRVATDPAAPASQLTVGEDPRITDTGQFLRATKLDELPQLFNVLLGEMSLVGPRPEVPKYAFLYPQQEQVWSVRPGITDAASIAFRDESSLLADSVDPESYYVNEVLPKKIALYLEYVRTRSLWGDIVLLFSTIGAVLRKG
jgi:lipopolysaccharide/colanic/teichoic acid biosynthesis glycosyltransferase